MSRLVTEDFASAVGNTPLVLLRNIPKNLNARIAVKLEYMNPTLSGYARAAKSIFYEGEQRGELVSEKSILIVGPPDDFYLSLVEIANNRKYKVIFVMSAATSNEMRLKVNRTGAQTIETDPAKGAAEVYRVISVLLEQIPNSIYIDSLDPAHHNAHYTTTGPEIWNQTESNVDIFLCGVNTGAMFSGVGNYLKWKNKKVDLYAVDSYEKPLIDEVRRRSLFRRRESRTKQDPENFHREIMKGCIHVKHEDAVAMTKRLAEEEGILVSISSGANLHAALKLAKRKENSGKLIVTVATRHAETEFSTDEVYKDLMEEMERMKPVETDVQIIKIARNFLPTQTVDHNRYYTDNYFLMQ